MHAPVCADRRRYWVRLARRGRLWAIFPVSVEHVFVIVAGRWPEVSANAVEPGWVATKMGGAGAPDDLAQAPLTQCGWPWARRRPTSLAATSTTANLGVWPRSLRTVSFISRCSRLAHR